MVTGAGASDGNCVSDGTFKFTVPAEVLSLAVTVTSRSSSPCPLSAHSTLRSLARPTQAGSPLFKAAADLIVCDGTTVSPLPR